MSFSNATGHQTGFANLHGEDSGVGFRNVVLAGGFHPLGLPSLQFLGDTLASSLAQATDGTTPATSNGHAVKYWSDLSGNGNHVTSASNNPVLSVVNGVPTVAFDSNDRLLKTISSATQANITVHCLLQSNVHLATCPYVGLKSTGEVPFFSTRWTTNAITPYFTAELVGSPMAEDKQWHYVAVTRTASGIKVYVDGTLMNTFPVGAAPTVDAILLGACFAYGNTNILMAHASVAFTEHTATDIANYHTYLRSRFSAIYPYPPAAVYYEMNSLGTGAYITNQTDTIPYKATDTISGIDYWFNASNSGHSTTDMLGYYDTRTKPFLSHITDPTKRILVFWEGTNDIAVEGVTAQQCYDNIEAYCTQARADGWLVVLIPILSRGTDVDPATFNTKRNAVNPLLDANHADFSDAYVPIHTDPDIGADDDYLNATYFTDGIHLTAAGNTIVAAAVKTAIESLL